MTDELVIRGAREHNLRGCLPRAAAGQAHRVHRPVRIGQVVAGLRHHLRRGAAPLRRVPVGLRPPVPGPDGQARRRLHRRPVAGHLHRPEDRVAQPALHGGHRHRGLRLPAAALRPHRGAARSRDRRRAGAPDAPADRRPHPRAARRHALPGAGPGGAGPQGHLRDAARGSGQGRASPEPSSTATCTSWATIVDLARYEMHTIQVVVDRLVTKDGIERRLTESIETALGLAEGVAEIQIVPAGDGEPETIVFSQHLSRPSDGKSFEELAPRNFSFNSPYGACPTCDGLGTRVRGRSRARRARSGAVARRRRDLAVVERAQSVLPPADRGGRRRQRRAHRRAVGRAHGRPAEEDAATASRAGSPSGTRTGTAGSAATTPSTRASSRT